jgi:hypothetical protein
MIGKHFCGTLEVYEILVANGFKLDPFEDLAIIMKNIEGNPKVKNAMKVIDIIR